MQVTNKSWLRWLRYLALLMILLALVANLDLLGFTGANQLIKADIITDVKLYELLDMNEDGPVLGLEIKDITLPNPYNENEDLPDLYIRYDFSFPAGHVYADGDYFIFQLPDYFAVNNDVPGVIKGMNGTDFGTFILTKIDKQVRLNFDNIQGQAVTGYVAFGTSLEVLAEEIEIETVIPIFINEKLVKTLKLNFAPKVPNLISKTGLSDRPFNSEYITWAIDFNKELKTISEPIIIDEIEENLGLDPASLQLFRLNLQLKGGVSSAELVYGVGDDELFVNQLADLNLGLELGKTDEGKDFQLTFVSTVEGTTPQINEAYRLRFRTDILDWNAEQPADEYTNQATLSGTVAGVAYTDNSADSIVEVERNKTLTKKVKSYDPITQTITWQLEVNYNEKAVNPFTITDVFGDNQQFIEGSLVIKKVNINVESGAPTISADPYSEANYIFDLVAEPKGLSITITNNEDKSSAFLIEYQTTALDRVLAGVKIINIASFNGKVVESSRDIQQKVLEKDHSGVDYNSKTINWTITVNQDKYWDPTSNTFKYYEMRDLVLDDIFTYKGLTFDGVLASSQFQLTLQNGGGSPAFQVYARDDEDDGFRIELAETINVPLTISYKTKFDYEQRTNPSLQYLENKVSATWEDDQGAAKGTLDVVKRFYPDSYTLGNGFKTGEYNAVDKKIYWEIVVNYNLQSIDGARVTDYVYGNQELNYASIKVYNAQLNGIPNTAVEVGAPLAKPLVELTSDNGRHGFSVDLGDISTAYIITYETDLNDRVIAESYDNVALLTDGENTTHAELSETVAIPDGSVHVKKGYLQAGRILQWTVDINPTQSKLTNVQVTDSLSVGQILLEESIKLYSTTVSINGNYEEDQPLTVGTHYTITTNSEDSFTLAFVGAIERPYILKYDTFLMVADNTVVSNAVNLTATEGTLDKNSDQESFTVRITRGWGGGEAATADKGDLIVEKKSANDNSLLAGAVFELWYVSGDVRIKIAGPLTTGTDGRVTFSDLPYDRYELREVTAPTGYVKREDGVYIVDIDDSTVTKIVYNDEIIRAVRLKKLDSQSEAGIPGVHFRLHRPGGIQTDHYTGPNGEIALNDLPVGSYYFEEIAPAVNYSNNETPLNERSFTIDEEQIAEKVVTMHNSFLIDSGLLLKKEISTDNGLNWIDVNSATGPEVPVGDPVLFRFTITNNGNVPLTDITITDQITGSESVNLSNRIPADPLQPQASYTFTLTGH
jgi:uncharacterized repeat protein (TIGR01451 family)